MDRATFEELLYEEESATLDVKKEQYPFAKATDDEKSELLKDILGFANAWRRSDAYILIGVEEIRGGPHNVIGISQSDHLDDHSLQQFVNKMTNRPVRFHYRAFVYEGKHVGIIQIEQQQRPIDLKKDFGKLKKDKVYVRRGSSTDPTKPATNDEIRTMGNVAELQAPALDVQFAEIRRDSALGPRLTWNAELVHVPTRDEIPELTLPPHRYLDSGQAIDLDPWNKLNRDFLRELAEYEVVRRLFRPLRLVVWNAGEVAATNVRCELAVHTDIGAMVWDTADWPDAPRRYCSAFESAGIKGLKSPLRRTPGEVSIRTEEERILIAIECGDLQPGRRVWSDVFYAGKGQSGEFELVGQIYADNLPRPKDFKLAIEVNVRPTSLTLDDLRELPEPPT